MTKEQLLPIAIEIAKEHEIPSNVFCGLIERESGWNQTALRFEPGFYERYILPIQKEAKTPMSINEAMARSTSWGLCQTMGQVARELGYVDSLWLFLTDVNQAMKYGALKLNKCILETGSMKEALLRYNGGGNPSYAEEVLKLAEKY